MHQYIPHLPPPMVLALGGLGGLASSLFGGWSIGMKVLAITIIIDYLSENAQLRAEKYTDCAIRDTYREFYTVTNQQSQRICELEKYAAVNATRDADFRREVRDCYVHQPRVHFDHRKIQTEEDCCCTPAPGAPAI